MVDQVIKLLWNRRNHQDNLVHTRLSWLIATQAFLLIAFVNAAVNSSESGIAILLKAIPFVGIVSTCLVYVSILGGIKTYKKVWDQLHKAVECLEKAQYQQGEVLDYSWTLLPRSWCKIFFVGFLASWVVPFVFIVLWCFLLVTWWN